MISTHVIFREEICFESPVREPKNIKAKYPPTSKTIVIKYIIALVFNPDVKLVSRFTAVRNKPASHPPAMKRR